MKAPLLQGDLLLDLAEIPAEQRMARTQEVAVVRGATQDRDTVVSALERLMRDLGFCPKNTKGKLYVVSLGNFPPQCPPMWKTSQVPEVC